jgi:hypothetical protein
LRFLLYEEALAGKVPFFELSRGVERIASL